MHYFNYNGKELYCEDVPVQMIAAKEGTPFYLYSHATLKRHFLAFEKAFQKINTLICYSAKANSNLAVLQLFAGLGGGMDIVSGGELYRGLKAGFAPEKIVYSGVGKRIDEIDYALAAGILMFNVESLEELELINQRASLLKKKAPVAIRVNPDVDPKTHPYISTGLKKNKFGIDTKTAVEGYKIASKMANIEILGIDCHIGSQITATKPFQDALNNIILLINEIQRLGVNLKYLDLGGGLGITYDDESPPDPDAYANAVIESLKGLSVKLIIEPGRAVVGNAGILVTRVLYRKSSDIKQFVIVDAAMNDLVRPTLYEAFHQVIPVLKSDAESIRADIVGPICETGDFLAVDRIIPNVSQGDLLAIMSSGAYGFTMSSNYCSRLKLPEVMVKGDQFYTVRKRQEYADLITGELLLP